MIPYTNIPYKEIGDKYIIFIYIYIQKVISTCYNDISEIYLFLIYVLIFTAEHHNIR